RMEEEAQARNAAIAGGKVSHLASWLAPGRVPAACCGALALPTFREHDGRMLGSLPGRTG
ncbi:hypothetical protein, partial [Erythrobacter sp. HI0019]|uniref:hypothetical protein n=1 Tax=Erythrobacter sp. HI0019 TaxID=1822222 RepID=UPI001F3B90C6